MKPSTLQEAITVIQEEFPALELQKWASEPEDLAVAQAHFNLGGWIRNQWIYSESPLCTEIRKSAWFLHDDEISSVITRALWRVLNGAPCPTIQELVPSEHWTDGYW
jgi:hypothetical protein